MIVVSDASPLITLARVGRLDLLAALYGRVIVPEAVWREITDVELFKAGVIALSRADWLEHRAVKDTVAALALRSRLDEGESEAIILALELGADLLLIDERPGRRVAVEHGVRVVGLLGLLNEAKHRGLIERLTPVVTAIRQADFRISPELVERILREAGDKAAK